MPPFLNGVLFGLIFIFSFGPGFFALIQASMQRGFLAGILLAVGIALCDLVFATAILLGFSTLLEDDSIKMVMAIGGAIILMAFGIYSLVSKPRIKADQLLKGGDHRLLYYLLRGFLINLFNPFILIFWVTIVSVINAGFDYSTKQLTFYFAGMLLTILTLDITKALLSHRLRHLANPVRIGQINKVFGIVMILFAVRIVYFLIENQL